MTDVHFPEQRAQSMRVAQALDAARAMGVDALDTQLLLLYALGRPSRERAWLLAHDQDTLLEDDQAQFLALAQRRAIGVPLAYLTGEREFYGLPFLVDRRVLIPRPETEGLVEWALELLPDDNSPRHVLDLGTGSGAIAVTLKHERPRLEVTAVDASAAALAVAGVNAEALLAATSHIRLLCGEWFAPVGNERFDLIASNPPYVAEGDSHLGALSHEPQTALVAGPDGLADLRTIVSQAPGHLVSGGWLLLEHGYDQGSSVRELLAAAGFSDIATRKDLAGLDRTTAGRWLES